MKYHAYLFVDGSASKGDDVGGWAAVAATTSARKLLYGVDFPTTISRCELRPIVEGLRWIRYRWCKSPGCRICVYSDSEYTVKTLSGIYPRHKNEDLWKALDEVAAGLNITYIWRERNSLPYMTLCDGVCGAMRRLAINHIKTVASNYLCPEDSMPQFPLPEDSNEPSEAKSPV